MKIKLNIKYLCAFIVIFVFEALIALFVHDNFVRPYVGDALVVALVYCFVRAFVQYKGKLLPIYIFIFAVAVEVGQYFDLAELLGLSDYIIARVIIGSTFDIMDIACYLAGCVGLFLFEGIKRRESRV